MATHDQSKLSNPSNPQTGSEKSLRGRASEAAEKVADAAQSKVEDAASAVGDSLGSAADRLRDGGRAEGAAQRLETAGAYLNRADYQTLISDVTGLIRRNPVPTALAAFGLGYLIAKIRS